MRDDPALHFATSHDLTPPSIKYFLSKTTHPSRLTVQKIKRDCPEV
jgi:hypothetical protein